MSTSDRQVYQSDGSGADISSVRIFLEAATKRLDIQFAAHAALDARAANTMSVGSAILPITFGLLGLGSLEAPAVATACLLLACGAYAKLLGFSWLIVRKTDTLAAGPQLTVLRGHLASGEYSPDGLGLWVAGEYETSATQNEQTLFSKAAYVGRASYALYIESALLSAAAIVTLLFG